VINHKKGEREPMERGHQPKNSLQNSGTSLFVPQGNFRGKGQRYKYPIIYCPFEVDDTQKRRREKEIS
jgi:hypothetical protein